MRRRLITSLVAVLGTAGLTLSLASPASADDTVNKRCTFRLAASNGDITNVGQVVYVDTKFVIYNGHPVAKDIVISNYTGRTVTFINDRWQDLYTGQIEKGTSGDILNGRAVTWHGSLLYSDAPDGSNNMRVNVNMEATSRPGLHGGCSNYITGTG